MSMLFRFLCSLGFPSLQSIHNRHSLPFQLERKRGKMELVIETSFRKCLTEEVISMSKFKKPFSLSLLLSVWDYFHYTVQQKAVKSQ
ncbi:hypothetical protein BLX87_17210 [Bacillus sp. VT-16-64]|nr:hypothetical protein BLX87_17210 [Bacillus sp. VT-16-64]